VQWYVATRDKIRSIQAGDTRDKMRSRSIANNSYNTIRCLVIPNSTHKDMYYVLCKSDIIIEVCMGKGIKPVQRGSK